MTRYCVNKNADENGYHEVHTESCSYLPISSNRQDLGYHNSCSEAVQKAKLYYSSVDGCYYCCRACHKH